jgi:hypothetical protein
MRALSTCCIRLWTVAYSLSGDGASNVKDCLGIRFSLSGSFEMEKGRIWNFLIGLKIRKGRKIAWGKPHEPWELCDGRGNVLDCVAWVWARGGVQN